MPTLSSRTQLIIGAILVLLLVATRGHHFATLQHLPGATWAVLFLVGVYLRPAWVLPALFLVIWGLDAAAVTWGGSSGFCYTPAYAFLLPAYGALWLSGRCFARFYSFRLSTLLPLAVTLLAGAAACELFSSGGFYFFSGRFAEPTMMEFAARLLKYFPQYLQSLVLYVGTATALHVLFVLGHNGSVPQEVAQRQAT